MDLWPVAEWLGYPDLFFFSQHWMVDDRSFDVALNTIPDLVLRQTIKSKNIQNL